MGLKFACVGNKTEKTRLPEESMDPMRERVKGIMESKQLMGAAAGCVVILFVIFFLQVNSEEVDTLVGPSLWALGVKRETALGTYRVWTSSDFKGGDLAFIHNANIEECLFACDENPECSYVAYSDGICYLKDAPTRFEVFPNRPGLQTAKRVAAKSLVSDQWHDATVKDTAVSSYRVWSGRVFEGDKIGSTTRSREPNMEMCLNDCDQDQDCVYVSFDGSECRLFRDANKHEPVKGDAQSMSAVRVRRQNSPDPLVAHHWTKGGPRETKDNIYQTWASCQFLGADITAVKADSLDSCLEKCDAELFCRHVTLIGTECMLKAYGVQAFEMVSDKSNVWAAKRVASKRKADQIHALAKQYGQSGEVGDLHDDMLVGPVYDEGEERSTKFYRYQVWQKFDFWGGDLSQASEKLDYYSLESCMQACDDNADCQFAVVISGKECWLKNAPYQLTRVIDDRADVYAMMKLGAVGKQGKDKNTLKLSNSLPTSNAAAPAPFPRTYKPNPVPATERASSSGLQSYLVGILIVAGLAGGAFYYQKAKARYYINELS